MPNGARIGNGQTLPSGIDFVENRIGAHVVGFGFSNKPSACFADNPDALRGCAVARELPDAAPAFFIRTCLRDAVDVLQMNGPGADASALAQHFACAARLRCCAYVFGKPPILHLPQSNVGAETPGADDGAARGNVLQLPAPTAKTVFSETDAAAVPAWAADATAALSAAGISLGDTAQADAITRREVAKLLYEVSNLIAGETLETFYWAQ